MSDASTDVTRALDPEPETGETTVHGPVPASDSGSRSGSETESEPDARFTFANERTFLAWNRTALALVVGGLAVGQLLPPFPGLPWGRSALSVPMIIFGAALSIGGFVEWERNQQALRRARPLPRSVLPRVLAFTVAVIAVVAAVLSLLSAALG